LTKEIKKKDFTFEHELVPQHTILSKKEIEELLARYRIKPYQLPSIRASDPAVLAIESKPGDVLKIVRRSSTAGEIVVYRHVVED
jgi:DNA-directed RNA polymerase subunit H